MKSQARQEESLQEVARRHVLRAPHVCMHVLGSMVTDERILREASALHDAGYTVTIIDVEPRGARHAVVEDIRGNRVKHILMSRDFAKTRFKRHRLFRVASIILQSAGNLLTMPADIYHAHDLTALPACYLVAMLKRKPLVFDAHKVPLSELQLKHRWLKNLVIKLASMMMQRCAGIITASAPIAQEMQWRFQVPQVELVRNLPAYKAYVPSTRLHNRLGLARNSNVRIALYQGNIQADPQLAVLVQVAKLLDPHILLVLIGNSIGDAVSELEKQIKAEGVEEHIKILPPVPHNELLEWAASAHLGLILYEPASSLNVQLCLPDKLFEYLMAALPVLATPLDAIAEVLNTHQVGRIVESLEPTKIAQAINQLLADDVTLIGMRINALNAAREELCWERERQHLIYLYRALARC